MERDGQGTGEGAAVTLLELIRLSRDRLDDFGGSTQPDRWASDDSGCLWSNATLLAHAGEAQDEFFRRTRNQFDGGLLGETPVTAGAREIALDDRVLTVTRMEWRGEGMERARMLEKVCRSEADRRCLWDIALPKYWLNDLAPRRPWLLGPPDADGVLLLYGTRLPDALPDDWHPDIAAGWTLAIPHRRAPSLIDWIEYRAFLRRDSDTSDERRAAQALARFTLEVGPQIDALTESLNLKAAGRNWRARGIYT